MIQESVRRLCSADLARLLKQCAQAMDNEDRRAHQAGEQRWRGVAGEWSNKGSEICNSLAGPVWGPVCYFMLGGAWNDVLHWADNQDGTNGPNPMDEHLDGSSHEGGHQ